MLNFKEPFNKPSTRLYYDGKPITKKQKAAIILIIVFMVSVMLIAILAIAGVFKKKSTDDKPEEKA